MARAARNGQECGRRMKARKRRVRAQWVGLLLGAVTLMSALLLSPALLDPADSSEMAQEPDPATPGEVVEAASTAASSTATYPPDLKVPILMYHDIGSSANGLTVTPAMLAEQVDTLKSAGHHTISLDTLLLAMRNEPVSLPEKPVVLCFDDAYAKVYSDAYPILKERGFSATLFVITGLVGKDGYLTWEQINELAEAGWSVGCHTARHLDLRTLGRESLSAEIADARAVLQEKTGQAILSFCYPSGKYTDQVLQAVKDAGYYGAVTTVPGVAQLSDPPFTLDRVRVDGREGLATFKAKLSIP
ncbi:MAG: polysaccharide deacetylase family protein [Bacillota bacterium]